MRILALDLGSKRVGAALSDELGLTAQPLTVVLREPKAEFFSQVKGLIEKYEVTRIIIGLPRRMDGTLGPEAHRVLSLAEEMKTAFDLDVATWDERLSTVAAERVLLEADLSRKKRRQVVDKVAAAYILQSYLDYISSTPVGS